MSGTSLERTVNGRTDPVFEYVTAGHAASSTSARRDRRPSTTVPAGGRSRRRIPEGLTAGARAHR